MTRARKDAAEISRMTRRLLAVHLECTPAELAQGLAWYDRARAAAEGMAGAGGLERAASVIAHLSPRARWETNVSWAAKVLAAADAREPCPNVSTGAQRSKAWQVATGWKDPGADHGPKTGAFYRNILGDTSAVCVDAWAARAATGDTSIGTERKSGIGRATYRRIEAAYVRAAHALGMAPRDLQAAVWVHVRGSAE